MDSNSNKRKSPFNDEAEKFKRQRQTKNINLSSLNEDVLVEIFVNLNKMDLLQVVNANKMFLNSCKRAVERKYRYHHINLPFRERRNIFAKRTTKDFNRTLEFLKYFGNQISKMRLFYGQIDSVRRRDLHDFIVESYHDNLIEIEFNGLSNDLKIDKCFSKLKTIRLSYGGIDDTMCQFTMWFPTIENVFIHRVGNFMQKLNTMTRISSLKQFSLISCINWYQPTRDQYNVSKLTEFIENNPQLEILRLGIYAPLGFYDYGNIKNMSNTVAENAKMMTVKLDTDIGITRMLFPKDRIEHLEVPGFHQYICEFVRKCSHLKSLKFKQNVYSEPMHTTSRSKLGKIFEGADWELSANHRNLTYLEICFRIWGHFDPTSIGLMAIQPYLKQCNKLQSVKVRYHFYQNSPFLRTANANSFDTIKEKIDLEVYSFAVDILLEKAELSFTLTKL